MKYEKLAPYVLGFFVIASIVNIYSILTDFDILGLTSKPLLISSLGLWFVLKTIPLRNSYLKFFLTGLAFSVAGDTLLMFVKTKGELYFLLGLGSFLFAHIFYIAAFNAYPNFKKGLVAQKPLWTLPFCVVLFTILIILWENLGEFLAPVVIYAGVIISMSVFSFNMKHRVNSQVSNQLFAGAALFVLSDLIIALSKFKFPDANPKVSGIAIMVTYLLGQYLLTAGVIKIRKHQGNTSLK